MMNAVLADGVVRAGEAVPLGLIDEFLLDFDIGHVLILMFVLVMLAALPLRSRKILSINIVAFGLIFVLTPFWVIDGYDWFMYAGLGMVFIGTILFAFAES